MKETYKKAFAPLTCIAPIQVEEIPMKKNPRKLSFAFIFSLLVIFLGGGTLCYAQDVGGIRTRLEGWVNGEKKVVEAVDDGRSGYDFYEEGEEEPFMGGGGIEYDAFGNETKLSAGEVLENNSTFIDLKEGKVMLYDHALVRDITPLINDGRAKLCVVRDGRNYYWNIKVEKESVEYSITPDTIDHAEDYLLVE